MPFRADPAQVLRYFLDVTSREQRANRAYVGHRQLWLRYEPLAEGDPRIRECLLAVLGLEQMELTTDTQRVLPGSRELLENIEEVVVATAAAGFPDGRYATA